uniref:Uncharacterized protein n=1 Tax=Anguilla anguilla TaxID=7936 RepID=A0A0E9U307_ANGAN
MQAAPTPLSWGYGRFLPLA